MSGWPPTLPFATSREITYELWVKPNTLDPGTRYGLLHLDNTVTPLTFDGLTVLDGHVQWGDLVSDEVLRPDQWNHVVGTAVDSGTGRGELWVNGTPTMGIIDGTVMWGSNTSVLCLGGGESTSVTVLSGEIAEPAVYAYALFATQILEHYRSGLSSVALPAPNMPMFASTGSLPAITFIDPMSGPTAGGTFVTLNGYNFTGTTSVLVGGNEADFNVVSDNVLTFTTPAGSVGMVDVIVTNASGPGTTISFEYSGLPTRLVDPTLDSNSPVTGTPLTVDPGIWSNSPTITYQWYQVLAYPPAGPEDLVEIVGETSDTYTPTSADIGLWIGVVVTATNEYGSDMHGALAADAVIDASVPAIDTYATFDIWEPDVGDTITLDPGTWTGNPTSYSYMWFRVTTQYPSSMDDFILIEGETGLAYTVTSGDAGYWIGALVTATNAYGDGYYGVLTQAAVPGEIPSEIVAPAGLAPVVALNDPTLSVVRVEEPVVPTVFIAPSYAISTVPDPILTPSPIAASAIIAPLEAGATLQNVQRNPLAVPIAFASLSSNIVVGIDASGTAGTFNDPKAIPGPDISPFALGASFLEPNPRIVPVPARATAVTAFAPFTVVFEADAPDLGFGVEMPAPRQGVGPTIEPIGTTAALNAEFLEFFSEPNSGEGDSSLVPEVTFPQPTFTRRTQAGPIEPSVGFGEPFLWQGASPGGIGPPLSFPPPRMQSDPSLSNKNIVVIKHDLSLDPAKELLPLPWSQSFYGYNSYELERWKAINQRLANDAYRSSDEILGVLVLAYNIELRINADGEDTLIFSYPAEAVDSALIQHDTVVELLNRRYRIATIKDGRDAEGKKFFDVECVSLALDLATEFANGYTGDGTFPYSVNAEFTVDAKTVYGGVEQLLRETSYKGWSIGTIEVPYLDTSAEENAIVGGDPNRTFSMKERANTVLELLRKWAEVTGTRLDLNTKHRTINLLRPAGNEIAAPISFRLEYAHNITEMRREMKQPETTRLYPFGRDGIGIKDINNGSEYLENFDWYKTRYGIDTTVARRQFTKESMWEADEYITAMDLIEAARRKLAELSQPSISYEIQMASLPGEQELFVDINLGDVVTVKDQDLGIDINTEVVGMTRYWDEPWRDEIELSYLKPIFGSKKETTTSSDVKSKSGSIVWMRTSQYQYITGGSRTRFGPFSLTSLTNDVAIFGYSFTGYCSADATMQIEFSFAGQDSLIPTLRQRVFTGWNTISGTCQFIVPAGSANLEAWATLLGTGYGPQGAGDVSFLVGTKTDVNDPTGGNGASMYAFGPSLVGGGNTASPTDVTVGDKIDFVRLGKVADSMLSTTGIPLQTLEIPPDLSATQIPEPVVFAGVAQHTETLGIDISPGDYRFEPFVRFGSVTVITT